MPARLHLREGWLSFLLLFLLLFIVALSLQAANWAPGLDILNGVFVAALGVGLLFAKSRLSGFLMHPLSLLIGTFWIGLLSLSEAADGPWESQLAEVIIRVILWTRRLQEGVPSQDTLPFILMMAALFWVISYSAAWAFYRNHNIWGALLPAGITLLVSTYYQLQELNFFLIAYLVLAFLLVIRANLYEQQERWRQNEIAFSNEIQFDFMREGAVFVVLVVAMAWFLPTAIDEGQFNPILAKVGQPWGRAQQEWGRVFSSLNYRGASQGAWFGRTMSFRGPINRSERLVMTVKAPAGRYWRAVVFDRYTSAGWVVSDQRIVDGPEAGLMIPGGGATTAGRQPVPQEYTIASPAGTLLFTAGQPMQVSLATQVMYGGPAPSDAGDEYNLAQIYSRVPLYRGQTYTALSAIASVDQQSLRQSGDSYPELIEDHYTALPDTVPDRVHDLAREIAGEAPSRYDAALAIQNYLRALPYSETIPGPRPGEDGVDYFLFTERQGYCDYYASSMAVMLRSLGIPARIAQGYSQGTQLPTGEFEVRQSNAHTWVEAYFPGYGWVEFEPTASEPSIERPEAPAPLQSEDDALDASNPGNLADNAAERDNPLDDPAASESLPPTSSGVQIQLDPRVLIVPFALMALAGGIGGLGWIAFQRRWRGLGPVERLYDQVGLAGRTVGQRIDPTLTPREYVSRVSERVPPARPALTRLADLFSKQRFAREPLGPDEESEAVVSWMNARGALVRGAVTNLASRRPERKNEKEQKPRKKRRRRW